MSKQPSQRRKHIPQRMCVVCRESNAKRQLTRLVRTTGAGVQPDSSGKMNGRGAYLCDKVSCWKSAVETDVLAKALRTELTESDRARLREVMTTMSQMSN